MTKYNGRLKTKAQAMKWADKLEAKGEDGAAALLRNGWERVAARPELAEELYKLGVGDAVYNKLNGRA